jgi:hypothetical protein
MKRLLVPSFAILSLCLSGCTVDESGSVHGPEVFVADDGTLISGMQPGETKRHADDWMGPLADGTLGVIILGLDQDADAQSILPSDPQIGHRAFQPHDVPAARPPSRSTEHPLRPISPVAPAPHLSPS